MFGFICVPSQLYAPFLCHSQVYHDCENARAVNDQDVFKVTECATKIRILLIIKKKREGDKKGRAVESTCLCLHTLINLMKDFRTLK